MTTMTADHPPPPATPPHGTPQPPPTNERPLTPKDVARLLGYSQHYTYQLIREGVIPARRLPGRGTKLLIYRSELAPRFPHRIN